MNNRATFNTESLEQITDSLAMIFWPDSEHPLGIMTRQEAMFISLGWVATRNFLEQQVEADRVNALLAPHEGHTEHKLVSKLREEMQSHERQADAWGEVVGYCNGKLPPHRVMVATEVVERLSAAKMPDADLIEDYIKLFKRTRAQAVALAAAAGQKLSFKLREGAERYTESLQAVLEHNPGATIISDRMALSLLRRIVAKLTQVQNAALLRYADVGPLIRASIISDDALYNEVVAAVTAEIDRIEKAEQASAGGEEQMTELDDNTAAEIEASRQVERTA